MSNLKKYKDIYAFHPGYYLCDVIEEMEISQVEFATRMGTTPKTLSKLLNGEANISNDLAKKLSIMMDTSPELWLNLQNSYDEKIIEIETKKDFDEQTDIMKLIDYKYFVEVAKLPITTNPSEKIKNLCGFLKIADLRILKENDFLVNYRSLAAIDYEKSLINSQAWLQTAINLSKSISVNEFSAKKLKEYLPELRSMTTLLPSEFIPRLKTIFDECGVVFVILPHLKGSSISGAVKWINDKRVILALNNRGLTSDKFWFSLFHEIKHILQQKLKMVFITKTDNEKVLINYELEVEADKFAGDLLIPSKELLKLAPTKYITDEEIVAFAGSINIDPGIVVGRLQHDNIIAQNRSSNLKQKYDFQEFYSSI